MDDALHLAVALNGTGWHPASWREPDARPGELFSAGYWLDLVREAERGLLDFVTIEDELRLQSDDPFVPDERIDQVRGRLDAVLVAARVGPLTNHIGLVPSVVLTHTEPFHVSKAIATLDFVTSGRAGVQVRISARADEARHFGRRTFAPGLDDATVADHFAEAADYVEVMRRLWDSWEDDAEIRDVVTGRFIDRTKLHYIDFAGRWFSVRGPSITPRPPQGQPVVTALGHRAEPYRFIARQADIGFVTPQDAGGAREILGAIPAEREVSIFADLVVFLDRSRADAVARKQRLDERNGAEFDSDARIFTGTAAELADLITDWRSVGLSGIRFRPGALPHDLRRITADLVPELQRRGFFRTHYAAGTLRGRLGRSRPANRYAA